MNPAEKPFLFSFFIFYSIGMVIQVSLPCWFGNEVILSSFDLGSGLFYAKWQETAFRLWPKDLMIFFLMKSNRPMRLKAGKFFIMHLATLTAVF
jgi:hypothetical protein